MTTQEIREMLDSTINSNNTRGISGQSLNAALNTILDYIEGHTPDVEIEVDRELNGESTNAIANAAVTAALAEITEVLKSALTKDDFIFIDLRDGGSDIRNAFESYNLANKLNKPLPCLILEDNATTYSVATMIVEGYNSSLEQDGTDVYKCNFLNFDFTSKIPVKDSYLPRFAWSADGVANNFINTAYLFTPSTNLIQSLGNGVVAIPTLKTIFTEDLSIDNMQVGNLYLAFDKETVEENTNGIITGSGVYAVIEDPKAQLEGKRNMTYVTLSCINEPLVPTTLVSVP